jgi:hypothetical protein
MVDIRAVGSTTEAYKLLGKLQKRGFVVEVVAQVIVRRVRGKSEGVVSLKPRFMANGGFEMKLLKVRGPVMMAEDSKEWVTLLETTDYTVEKAAQVAEELYGVKWRLGAMTEEQLQTKRKGIAGGVQMMINSVRRN